jgi:DMSO/TMAO reductase YedYZ molybdopterin-dependent catalytic subunit
VPKAALFGAPTGTPILAITGGTGGATPVNADYAALDHMATRTYNIYEPYEKKIINFTGVELGSVLDAAGVPASATKLALTALDDYRVNLSTSDVRKGGVILATRVNGELIPVDHGGPIRVVFEPSNSAGTNPDQWIWSLKDVVAT